MTRAARCARRYASREGLGELNGKRRAEGADPIGVGVGVNSGKAVAGNMGSSNRLNYTCARRGGESRVQTLCHSPGWRGLPVKGYGR